MMLILDKPRPFRGTKLWLPLYHRGHLSLLSGTKLWLCLLPGTKVPSHMPEIIVSPINFASWPDLWRIEATVTEEVGVVHKILKVLRDHNINVLAEESSSIDRQRFHRVELIVDLRAYASISDGDTAKRSTGIVEALPDLCRALLAQLTQQITFMPSREPRLRISRMNGLHEAHRAYQIVHHQYINGQGFRPTVEEARAEVVGSKGWITLPRDILTSLSQAVNPIPPSEQRAEDGLSYLLVSDTKERYLRSYFVRPSDRLLSVTLSHEEKIGALSRITDILQRSRFNILTSLCRLYTHGGRAQYELVLQPPLELTTNEAVRREFERILGVRDLLSEYKLEVSYKLNYKSPFGFDPLKESDPDQGDDPAVDLPKSVEETLERQVAALRVRMRGAGASAEDSLRSTLAGKLLDEERRVRQNYIPRKILFLSFSFGSSSEKINTVVAECEKLGFEVTIAKQLSEPVVREGIIRKISESTHFLAIWGDEGAVKAGRQLWPSVWLHWELGVASAMGLRPRLLVSNAITSEAWRVYPEVPHEIFESSLFLQSLRVVLEAMANDPFYREPFFR